jgi:hypothetical protein
MECNPVLSCERIANKVGGEQVPYKPIPRGSCTRAESDWALTTEKVSNAQASVFGAGLSRHRIHLPGRCTKKLGTPAS